MQRKTKLNERKKMLQNETLENLQFSSVHFERYYGVLFDKILHRSHSTVTCVHTTAGNLELLILEC